MSRPKKSQRDYIDLTGDFEDEPGPSSRRPGLADADVAAAAPKPKGRKRKAAGEEAAGAQDKKGAQQKPEKRVDASGKTVRYASAPSIKVQERIARAMPGSGHRLFLIDHKMLTPVGSEGGAAEEFAVLGATGNVYTVTVCRQPQCTCPDFLKGNLCKHILFVMLRVLRLPRDEPLVWQRALLTEEVDAVLSGEKSEGPAGVQAGVLAGDAVRAQYRRLSTGEAGAGASSSEHAPGNQRPVEGDCPICFEPLQASGGGEDKIRMVESGGSYKACQMAGAKHQVTFCAGSCGNNVHMGCMRRWISSNHSTCPLCRAPWVDGLNPAVGPAGQPEQYTNLAALSEAHQHADTTLEALYGDRSVWIRAGQGAIGRRQAANLWRTKQGGY